ncbi:hypothetical protein [Olivibacter sp. SDN3]|uniref:hypothetical protein n=1 Tax=Olivibacter sp. SDN3 TaxID=2764720 RepID=UPI00351BE683
MGAHDGITYSNTRFLEQYRHREGVCFEPNKLVFEELENNRSSINLNAAIRNDERKLLYMRIWGSCEMLSGMLDYFYPIHVNRIKREMERKGEGMK